MPFKKKKENSFRIISNVSFTADTNIRKALCCIKISPCPHCPVNLQNQVFPSFHCQTSQKRVYRDFPGGTVVKNPPANAGDTGSIPGTGRSHMPRSSLGPASHNYWAHVLQLLKPTCLEPTLHNKRSHLNKHAHRKEEWPPLPATRESPRAATKTQRSQKNFLKQSLHFFLSSPFLSHNNLSASIHLFNGFSKSNDLFTKDLKVCEISVTLVPFVLVRRPLKTACSPENPAKLNPIISFS